VGLVVSFNASGSTASGATIANYTWDFGDGGDGNGVSPSHTYGSGGTYTVVLTITDNLGRQDDYSANVTVP
jgi:PKD repeat protein